MALLSCVEFSCVLECTFDPSSSRHEDFFVFSCPIVPLCFCSTDGCGVWRTVAARGRGRRAHDPSWTPRFFFGITGGSRLIRIWQTEIPLNSRSLANVSPVSAMLICLRYSQFGLSEKKSLSIWISNWPRPTCIEFFSTKRGNPWGIWDWKFGLQRVWHQNFGQRGLTQKMDHHRPEMWENTGASCFIQMWTIQILGQFEVLQKSHSKRSCVNLPTQFKIHFIWENFTWCCLLALSGTHLYLSFGLKRQEAWHAGGIWSSCC